jgi:hypothetical protein
VIGEHNHDQLWRRGLDARPAARMPQVVLVLGVVAAVGVLTLVGGIAAWTAVSVVGASTVIGAVCCRILAGGPLPRLVATSNGTGERVVRLVPRGTEDSGDGAS